MVRMYRAGTAFVEVVPRFGNMQRDIAKSLRNDLKKALSDKDAYSELDRNLKETFRSAMSEAKKDVDRDVQKMVKDVDRTVTKGAHVSARNVKKVVEKELGGGWHGEQMRKIGKQLEKTLGTDTFKKLRAEHSDMRKEIERDIHTLSTSFTKTGERDSREVERAYVRLQKAMDKIQKLEKSGLSKARMGNVREAGKALGGDNYQKLVNGLSDAEIKDLNRRNNEAAKAARKHAKELNVIQEGANREARRIDNEERKRQLLEDQKDAARARDNYRSLYETQYQNRRDLAKIGTGGTRKQEKLTFKRDKSIDAYQKQVQGLMGDLAKLNSMRPLVHIETREAYSEFEKLRAYLNREEMTKVSLETDFTDQEQVKAEARKLKAGVENILKDIDLDVEFHDERASAAIKKLKAEMATVKDIDLDVDVDVEGLLQAKTAMEGLRKAANDIRLKVNTEGAYDDVLAVEAALNTLKDKHVGVDITEREAVAEIQTINLALASIKDKHVDVDIDYDRSPLEAFVANSDRAERQMKRLARSIKDANVSMSESTQAFRIFNPILAGVALVGAPAVSALSGVVAGLGGIISFAPGAAAGLSPLIFAFAGLEDATKKYEKAQEALAIPKKDLTAAQKDAIEKWEGEKDAIGEATVAWIKYADEFKTQLAGVQKGAREGFFPGLQASLETIMSKYAKPFTGFLEEAGERLGTVARIWANALTTDESAEWFARVGRDTEGYTLAFTEWVSNTVSGLANIVDAFRPFAREFSDWLINSSKRWEDWTASLTGSDALLAFFDSVRNTLPGVGDLLKNVSELFVNITLAVEPFSVAILDAINGALDFVNAMDPKVLGAILGAVGGLTGGLMLLSGVMAGVGALSAVLSAISGSLFTQIAFGLGSFVAVSGTALGATTALGSETSVLGDALLTLGAHLEGAADLTKSFWGLLGDLLEAVEPLIPTVADLVGTVMELTLSMAGGLVGALSGVVSLIGSVLEGFSNLPMWIQETTLVVAGGALAFNKMQSGIGAVIPLLQSGLETFQLWAMYGKDGIGKVTEMWTGFKFGLEGATQMMGAEGGIMYSLKGMKSGLSGVKDAAVEAWDGLSGGAKAAIAITAIAGALVAMNAASEAVNLKPAVAEIEDFDAAIQGMGKSAEAAKTGLDNIFSPEGGEGSLGSWADTAGWLGGTTRDVNDFSSAMEVMGEKSIGAGGSMREFRSEIYTLFGAFGDTQWDAVRGQLEAMDESLAGMASTDFASAAAGYRTLADAAEEAGVPQSELNEYLKGYRKELENTAARVGNVKLSEEEYYAWMRGEVPDAIQEKVDAMGADADGLAGVVNKTAEAEEATKKLIDANNELAGRFLNQEEANLKYQETLDGFTEHMKTAKRTMDESTKAGQENRRWFLKMAEATKSKADADLQATGDAEAYTNSMWDQRKELVRLAQKFGMTEDQAEDYANTLLEIPRDVKTKAQLKNLATKEAEQINKDLDENLKDRTIKVTITKEDPFGIWQDNKGPKGPGPWKDGYVAGHDGHVLKPFAEGGLNPMDPVAQMVKPNTWRVVGDRMDVDEAYIPLNGSTRSWSILQETIKRMPAAKAFHNGGIAQFAAGAVASPAAPAAKGDDPAQAGDMTAVSEAFAALAAALGEEWTSLLDGMISQANLFYANLLATTTTQNALVLSAHQASNATTLAMYQAHLAALLSAQQTSDAVRLSAAQSNFSALLGARSAYNSSDSSSNSNHLSALSSTNSSWRDNQLSATTSFLESNLSRFQSGDSSIRSHWTSHFSGMSDISTDFRRREGDRLDSFLNGTMISTVNTFGSNIKRDWSGIWNSLVSSAKTIFSVLPRDIGNILSSTSGAMNKHIVTPYNKVVSDLDLSKKLKLQNFPTQSYADGGTMKGYTPGRDVHKFYSPTGGLLELSGGEPVLRPELGAVLGTQWVDQANAAARTGGVRGARQFLSGGQAYANGGIFDGGHQALASGGRIKKDHAGLVQLGHVLQGLGVSVTQHSKFGGNTGGHAPNSWHNRDGALDLNTAPGTSAKEQADFDKLMPILWKLGWGTIWRYPNHYNHAHVDLGNTALGNFNRNPKTSGDLWEQLLSMKVGPATGGGSSVDYFDLEGKMSDWLGDAKKAAGNGALPELMTGVGDKVFTALAKEKADKFVETSSFGGTDFSSVGNGPIKEMAKGMLEKKGWGAQFSDLDWLLTRESGWNPKAQNPSSTAYGLFQFLNSTWGTVGARKTSDPRKQLEAGMNYIDQRYGDVRGARSFWNKHHWYKDGGVLDFLGTQSHAKGTAGIEMPNLDLSPEVLLRDNGGPLPTGYSVVHNNLGHEETIIPKTVDDVTATFERLEQVEAGDGGLTISDSYFGATAQEVVTEIDRSKRIARIAQPVKF